jgi:hypothetical protein
LIFSKRTVNDRFMLDAGTSGFPGALDNTYQYT